ncbi:MAG: Do family serine endopeptidase [Xanthobacteraceae bacterium]|nr:Do family serine endopeptidase [Xanthobacteraceae bacterium]
MMAQSIKHKVKFTGRRFALMASTAGLAVTVLLTGPGLISPKFPAAISSARAADAAPASAGFGDLVAKVKPAVVSVRVRIDEKVAADEQGGMQPGRSVSPFEQFGFGDENPMPQRHQMMVGEGSGFFISPDGYIVTNNHVVDHAKSVQVTMDDGTIHTARVIGTDPKTDLALIKVDGRNDFPSVSFADKAPRVGDWVVAVGNPFGLGGTVTAGIVSARGRDIGAGPYDDYIQIDAPINKGNSGGPAFDVNGNVIGINTAIFSPSGGSVGIGFDIPADTAKLVVAKLKDKGYVTRGWLGVQVQPVTAEIADSIGLKQARGAIVDNPQAGSPAASAGIQSGDVIAALNGAQIKDSRDLARNISLMAPGTSVKLDVIRHGEQKVVTLTLGEMPNDRQANAREDHGNATGPRLGLDLAPASEVAGSGDKGLVVMNVDPNGPAAERGFKTGDVILAVGGKPVGTVAEVKAALSNANANGKQNVLIQVKTADAIRFVAVPLATG